MTLSRPAHCPPVEGADLLRLGALATLAVTLLAPGRHYIGPLEEVSRRKLDEDSFPLSTYPMFSEDRRGRITVPHVVGFTASGQRLVPHYTHYGAGGLNQVRKQIARDVRQGRAVEVAQRYAASLARARARGVEPSPQRAARQEREASIVRVAVVRSRFRFDDWFAGRRDPSAESVMARCDVGGTAVEGPGGRLTRFRKETA